MNTYKRCSLIVLVLAFLIALAQPAGAADVRVSPLESPLPAADGSTTIGARHARKSASTTSDLGWLYWAWLVQH